MLIIHGSRTVDRPVAVTIGNFDGVHRGHQAMVARTIAAARRRGLRSCVLTFEPHPREFFSSAGAPTRLTSLREKLELLGALGMECTYIARFDRRFASHTAQDFVHELLIRQLRAAWILVGGDFRFGAGRAGDLPLLTALGRAAGVEVEVIETITDGGLRISSSAVRSALAQGELGRAESLLGRRYSISGRVVHGDKLGRTLGYPTANVQLKHNHPPLLGIYAVRVHGIAADALDGVASLGYRPTVSNATRPQLEVFVFDFSGELYGCHVRVEFIARIRDEEKYDTLEALKAAIGRDCVAAREILQRRATEGAAEMRNV